MILDLLYLLFKQKLPLIEEKLRKLVTDDPSVVKASLEEYSDLVYPANMSIIQRYAFNLCYRNNIVCARVSVFC